MVDQNSFIGQMVELIEAVSRDVAAVSNYPTEELARDLIEIRSRTKNEGISFLTKVLPRLGKALDRALASSTLLKVDSFRKRDDDKRPIFLGKLFEKVFDSEGRVRFITAPQEGTDVPKGSDSQACREAALAVGAIRQICYCFYKLNIPYTDAQAKEVIDSFIRTEADLDYHRDGLDWRGQSILREARKLVHRVLANLDPRTGIPRHGPGAVATGEKSPEKHHFGRYYRQLHAYYPFDEWMCYNLTHLSDSLDKLMALEEVDSGIAKVILVPKDSRGPRLISCEPLEYQWIQQSMNRLLVDTIEAHPLTRRHVNFVDQTINRDLALRGSKDSSLSTLDMKEASDRVSLNLVEDLFPEHVFAALKACRTPRTLLPDGSLVTMKKFAPMGSAVCFPVEALCFFALCVGSLIVNAGLSPNKARTKVWVYGDDIICDSEHHGIIANALPLFGLMLNEDKCCTSGLFKESCGMDAYYGHPVTPLRMREVWLNTPNPLQCQSLVEFSNALWDKGLFEAAEVVERMIPEKIRRRIPYLPPGEYGVLCFTRCYASLSKLPKAIKRYNRRLHRMEVKGLAPETSVMGVRDSWSLVLRVTVDKERVPAREHDSKLKPSGRQRAGVPFGDTQYPVAHRNTLTSAWTAVGV